MSYDNTVLSQLTVQNILKFGSLKLSVYIMQLLQISLSFININTPGRLAIKNAFNNRGSKSVETVFQIACGDKWQSKTHDFFIYIPR